MSIFIKDDLRASVEAATGGQCTVLYTEKNQPTFMHIVPQFNLQDIDTELGTGTHPAFTVNSELKDSIFVGMYPGIRKNGELLSLPGVLPSNNATYSAFLNDARACGEGFGLTTNASYAALMLWSIKNGTAPHGNTNWGRSHLMTHETATRQDGRAAGDATGDGRTLTGSGPASWRHNGLPSGIADLVGNVWEFSPGLRLVDGEIQVIANNDAMLLATFDDSAPWKAILQDGTLVNPGTANTLKYDGTDTIQINKSVTESMASSKNKPFTALGAAASVDVPSIMRALLLSPTAGLEALGNIYVYNTEQRYPLRGGYWSSSGDAGPGALFLRNPASDSSSSFSARPAKVSS